MARSGYVYVLEVPGQPPLPWTVKHELRAWLQRLDPDTDHSAWRLWRCRDGRPGDAMTTVRIADVLDGT